MEVPGLLKNRMWKLQETTKKEVEFQKLIQEKIVWNFHGSWFLVFDLKFQ